LWIDCVALNEYLQSSESILSIRYIMDFIETLHVLQFNRVNYSRGETSYFFVNPNFTADQTVPDDFYKQPIDVTKANVLNGTRRLSSVHRIGLFERLLSMQKRSDARISKLEFARLRLKFALQRKLDLKRYELDIIDHNIEEPDYVKNQEIAGYYGNVELSLLKNTFGNFFPVYHNDEPTAAAATETDAQAPLEEQQVPMVVDEAEPSVDGASSTEKIPAVPETLQEVPVFVSIPQSTGHFIKINDENEPPRKRPRRNCNKKITVKETNDALLNLQKEFNNFESTY
jgi:hypothetical protein